MPVYFRDDTKKWGYRIVRRHGRYSAHLWDTKEEAEKEFAKFKSELAKHPFSLLTITQGNLDQRRNPKHIYYRENTKKWGYRFYLRHKRYRAVRWDTKEEAEKELFKLKTELAKHYFPPLTITQENFDQLTNVLGLPDFSGRFSEFVCSCVYAVVRSNQVLYVGMSSNGIVRPLSHQHHFADAFLPTDTIVIWRCGELGRAQKLEKKLIKEIRPTYNVTGVPGKRDFRKAPDGKFAGRYRTSISHEIDESDASSMTAEPLGVGEVD